MTLFFNPPLVKPTLKQDIVQDHVLVPLKRQQAKLATLITIKPDESLQAAHHVLMTAEQAIIAATKAPVPMPHTLPF